MDIWNLPQDETEAVLFFQNAGLLHSKRNCRQGHSMKLPLAGGETLRWTCSKKQCRETMGVRVGTWFSSSKLPFLTVVRFIYCWCEELTSSRWCKRQLHIGNNSTEDWNMYLRDVCTHALETPQQSRIGGPGKVVEIDESLFSKRNTNTEEVLPEQWIYGGVCRETNEIFMKQVPDRSAATLISVVKECIEPGSTIMSDCWKAYETDELTAAAYEHLHIDHTYNFVDADINPKTGPKTGANSHSVIERMWGSAKWSKKRLEGKSQHHLQTYLAEFLWRQKMLNAGKDVFEGIIEAIRSFWPPQNDREDTEGAKRADAQRIKLGKVKIKPESKAKRSGKKRLLAEVHPEIQKFEKGLVLTFSHVNEGTSIEDVKDAFNSHAPVAWAEFTKGDTEGSVVFKPGHQAETVLHQARVANNGKVLINGVEVSTRILKGDEETEYWKKHDVLLKELPKEDLKEQRGSRSVRGQPGAGKIDHHQAKRKRGGSRSGRGQRGAAKTLTTSKATER